MWTIIIVLIIGMIIGSKLKVTDKTKDKIGKFQYIGVILLLFSMGASLGFNDNLLKDLPKIGFEALLFGIFTTLFSILFVFLLTKKLFKEAK
jgi:uncharacterized membrane protein YbjE (DUF340 family)